MGVKREELLKLVNSSSAGISGRMWSRSLAQGTLAKDLLYSGGRLELDFGAIYHVPLGI